MQDCPIASLSRRRHSAFTLVELLVVIGIIVVLISILLPVVSHIRTAAQNANTKNFINELTSAINNYQFTYHAYPGPIGNMDIYSATAQTPYSGGSAFSGGMKALTASGFDTTSGTFNPAMITMSENLVLGLLGGLHIDAITPTVLDYDPAAVGLGPSNLNTFGIPTRNPPFLDAKQLSWRNGSTGKTGQYQDDSGSANDTIIPEFVDSFPDAMPILYLRARVGANAAAPYTAAPSYNNIVTYDLSETATPAARAGQYDLSQIIAYTGAYNGNWPNLTLDTATPPTGKSIGVGKSKPSSPPYTIPPGAGGVYHGLQTATYVTSPSITNPFPIDAYPYLINSTGTVRQKDSYILISAGPDRIYGTSDDICNFGTVGQ